MNNEARKPNPIDVHVGSRVRVRRSMMGMSQERLGDQLGVTFQQVQKYEKGTNRIGASRLQQMSTVLEVPIAFFFEGAPGQKPGAPFASGMSEGSTSYIIDFLSSPEGLQLNRAFTSIEDPMLRRRIVELVKSIADNTPGSRTADRP